MKFYDGWGWVEEFRGSPTEHYQNLIPSENNLAVDIRTQMGDNSTHFLTVKKCVELSILTGSRVPIACGHLPEKQHTEQPPKMKKMKRYLVNSKSNIFLITN